MKANQTKSIIDWNTFTEKIRSNLKNMKNTLKQDYFNTFLTHNAKRSKRSIQENLSRHWFQMAKFTSF